MTETEYKDTYYPNDFIEIGNTFFSLPKGFSLEIAQQEVSSTFATVDGHKRKDIIRQYESAVIKYEFLTEKDFQTILDIITALQNAAYGIEKKLYIKKQSVPSVAGDDFKNHFKAIIIDLVKPIKYAFKTRKNGLFIYSGITVNLN